MSKYKLTDKKPTESGYYWAKQEEDDPEVVEIEPRDCEEDDEDKFAVYLPGWDIPCSLSDFISWSERIEEPEE
ncbi:MAG: hypothetical protein M0Q91_12175 [Methanoregula sp.]|jgi:hypothetical protein|nr:hypothetical protein [Methanoregula sp.]